MLTADTDIAVHRCLLEMSWHGELSGGGPQPQILVRIQLSIEDLGVQEVQANSCG